MENINGYQLTTELKNDKSGYARWGFATKRGNEYFIKEFLSPVYPTDESVLSEEQLLRKRQICDEFYNTKRNFYDILNQCSTGNIITVSDFFRFKSKYYIVTEKVEPSAIEPIDIAAMDIEQKMLIIKVILHCLNILHKHNIVHGDIKPDNILIKKTSCGLYTAKIIDFDSSFLANDIPVEGEFQGDMVYLAPEIFMMLAEGQSILTAKIDIFALGILFHQYFCGDLPGFDHEKYDYAFEAVLDDCELEISCEIPKKFRYIIKEMLDKHPARRPSAEDIFKKLSDSYEEKATNNEIKGFDSDTAIYSSRLKSTMGIHAEKETCEQQAKSYFKKADDL